MKAKKINNKKLIFHIVTTSVNAAIIFVLTFFVKIPYANGAGYFNFSDALILFSTAFFSPIEGIIGGIIGTCIADILSGYSAFAPFTALAKGLEALLFYVLLYLLKNRKYLKYISFFISPLIMVLVYFVSYILLFNIEYALSSSIFDVVQGIVGGGFAIFLLNVLFKAHPKFLKNYYYKKALSE